MAKHYKKIIFTILLLTLPVFVFASLVNLENLKINLLKGDYKSCIREGEALLANSVRSTKGLDELYYYLGLAYLKEGNLLRASDIFDIILKEFKSSKFAEVAQISLADVYMEKGEFSRAQEVYQDLLKKRPNSKYKAEVETRLTKVQAKVKSSPVKQEVKIEAKAEPVIPEAKEEDMDIVLADNLKKVSLFESSGVVYSVQVGAFSHNNNAISLTRRLANKGYEAYVVPTSNNNKVSYKVRVGRFNTLEDAKKLERELSIQGYPTKICP